MAQQSGKEKINYAVAIRNFFSEVFEEAKKIVWPSRETLVQSTMVVLAVILALSVYMAAADIILNKLFDVIS